MICSLHSRCAQPAYNIILYTYLEIINCMLHYKLCDRGGLRSSACRVYSAPLVIKPRRRDAVIYHF